MTGVELLDVSATGMLLACDCALDVGHRAQVRMMLGREPFAAWIEVKRAAAIEPASPHGSTRCLVGAAFTSLDEQSARALHAFLPQTSSLPRTSSHAGVR